MTILITGASGSVGSRLVPRLVAAGHDCRALVREGRDVKLPDAVSVVTGDLSIPATLTPAVEGVSAVVHLAAVLRSPDADAIRRANIEGTRNLVEAVAENAPRARIVMASTSLVYGDELPWPARETDEVAPTTPYPASKVSAERDLLASDLPTAVLRFGYAYGDGDAHLDNAPRLFKAWGWHPAHVLHLIHHRDIAKATLLALTGALDGRIANVVDDAPVTAFEIGQIVGRPLEPSAAPLNNPWGGRLDGTLLRQAGFSLDVPTVFHAQRAGWL